MNARESYFISSWEWNLQEALMTCFDNSLQKLSHKHKRQRGDWISLLVPLHWLRYLPGTLLSKIEVAAADKMCPVQPSRCYVKPNCCRMSRMVLSSIMSKGFEVKFEDDDAFVCWHLCMHSKIFFDALYSFTNVYIKLRVTFAASSSVTWSSTFY